MITSITPSLEPSAIVVAAPYAPSGQIISGTSETALSIPPGPAPFPSYVWQIVEANIGFRIGMRVRSAAADATAGTTTWIEGVVTAWDETNLTVAIDLVSGVGLHTAWNINVTGQPGLQGQPGIQGQQGIPGPPFSAGIPIDSPIFSGVPTSLFTPGQGTTHAADSTLATTLFATTAVNAAKIDTALTGNPTAPTQPVGDNSTHLATTGFVTASFAPISNPVFLGDPRAPTPAVGDNDTSIATTAFVTASFAPLISPIFTGTPHAPTQPPADNTANLATTAFVARAIAPLAPINAPNFTGNASAVTPNLGDNSPSIATTAFVYNANLTLAPLISPHFTGTSPYPASSTPPSTSFDSSIATTAFVKTITNLLAPLQNPVFTVNPQAPTQPPGTYDSTIATTAFVKTNAAGYQPLAADLTSLAAATGAGVMYYRSAAGTWSPVEIGANVTFDSGVLSAAGGGGGTTGGIEEAPSTGTYFARRNATWAATPIQADAPSDGTNYVRFNATWASMTSALAPYALLAGPTAFTGTTTAPTPGVGNNTTLVATTAFVVNALGSYAPLAAPALTNVGASFPTSPTPAPASNDGTIATTAFVKTTTAPLAPLASPHFTGTTPYPASVTPLAGDNSTSISTTAFVTSAIGAIPGYIPPASITYAQIQNISATSRVLGRIAAGAGVTQELAGTDLVTIIDGNLSSLMAPGNWKNFYTDGSGILVPIGVGAAGTSYVGNGAAAAPSWMAWATAAQYAGNSANALLSTNNVWAAAALQTLTDAATVTPDFSTGFDFIWTLGATGRTLADATNLKIGQKGVIYLVQDGTGGRTITTWGGHYKFSGGTKPALTAAAAAVDIVSYVVKSTTEVECFFSANMS
jgi:hypothetical protein